MLQISEAPKILKKLMHGFLSKLTISWYGTLYHIEIISYPLLSAFN